MKNATKHADTLKALLKRLSKDGKPDPVIQQDMLKSLVRAAMSFDVPDAKADDAMKAIEREFVDLNELRVATDLEIQEMLGQRYPAIERRVAMITQSLNDIFEREHTLSLDRLKTISKRDARQFLRELPEVHPFVESYVMLLGLDGHAVPLDDMMLQFLIDEEVLDTGTTIEDAQKFLEHHLKAEECYEAYFYLRRGAQETKAKRKK